jgi:hypothetical protein
MYVCVKPTKEKLRTASLPFPEEKVYDSTILPTV